MIRAGLLAVLVAAATTAQAQTLGGGGGQVELPWWRVVGALAVCLALAAGLALVLRRRMEAGPVPGFQRPARRLQLLETIRLSHQTDICLLRYDDDEIIVAASPQGPMLVKGLTRVVEPPG